MIWVRRTALGAAVALTGLALTGLQVEGAPAPTAKPAAPPAPAIPGAGVWQTGEGDAYIELAACGPEICGTIVWLKSPIDAATGKPQLDAQNPDPVQRTKPLVGSPMLKMKPESPTTYAGTVYNAENGKTYSATLTVNSPIQVTVRGCVAMILCGSDTWSKVETPPATTATSKPAPGTTAKPAPAARPAPAAPPGTPPAPRTN